MLLHSQNSTCAYNHLYNVHQISLPPLQSIFNSLFYPYLFKKLSSQFPLTLPNLHNFSTPYIFASVQPSQQSTPKVFSLPQPLSQFRLHQAAREIGSLVRTNTVLFSPLTLKVWTVTTRLTITDSSSIFCSYLTQ